MNHWKDPSNQKQTIFFVFGEAALRMTFVFTIIGATYSLKDLKKIVT